MASERRARPPKDVWIVWNRRAPGGGLWALRGRKAAEENMKLNPDFDCAGPYRPVAGFAHLTQGESNA